MILMLMGLIIDTISYPKKFTFSTLLKGAKSTWSEHVWSTFIHRGYSDDVTEKHQEEMIAEVNC